MRFLVLLMILGTFSSNSWSAECPHHIKEIDFCAKTEWKEGPHWGKFSNLEVKYWKKGDSEKKLTNLPEDIVVYPWMIMPKGEHGGRSPIVTKLGDGHYQYERFQFGKMPGYWELRWRKSNAREKDEFLASFKVNLPE
jgi:hypothetical protein